MMLIVANARIFGGGFRVAPQADPEDGKLDAMAVANMGLGGPRQGVVRLLLGTHADAPPVETLPDEAARVPLREPPELRDRRRVEPRASAEIVVEAVPGAHGARPRA